MKFFDSNLVCEESLLDKRDEKLITGSEYLEQESLIDTIQLRDSWGVTQGQRETALRCTLSSQKLFSCPTQEWLKSQNFTWVGKVWHKGKYTNKIKFWSRIIHTLNSSLLLSPVCFWQESLTSVMANSIDSYHGYGKDIFWNIIYLCRSIVTFPVIVSKSWSLWLNFHKSIVY